MGLLEKIKKEPETGVRQILYREAATELEAILRVQVGRIVGLGDVSNLNHAVLPQNLLDESIGEADFDEFAKEDSVRGKDAAKGETATGNQEALNKGGFQIGVIS